MGAAAAEPDNRSFSKGYRMISLVPGASHVSDRVRQALSQAECPPREDAFADLLRRIRLKLLQAFVPGAEAEYTAVLLTGSGVAATEAALLSSVPHGKRAIVLNNGAGGDRLSSILGVHRLGIGEFTFDWGSRPDLEKIRLALRQRPEVHVVAMSHHDVSTGALNPIKEIAEVVDSQNRVFVVESISGLGGHELDIAGAHLYMVAGAPDECIRGVPGVSFVLVRKGFMERMKGYPQRSWYLHLPHYYENEEQGAVPFTPAYPVYAAFEAALEELLEEGVAARIQRYKQAAGFLRKNLAALKLAPALPPESYSHTVTSVRLPDGLSYDTLATRMKDRGYLIAPGLGPFAGKAFRLAHADLRTPGEMEQLVAALKDALAR